MLLHVIALIISQVMLLVLLYAEIAVLDGAGKHANAVMVVLRLVFVATLVASQAVFIYLLLKFTTPF